MVSVAIDGPAGAGKSTLARRLAAELGYIYVDTGAMFRTIGLYALRAGKDPKDNEAVNTLLPEIELHFAFIDGEQHIYLGGEDVSSLIRTEEVGMAASAVGANPAVRIHYETPDGKMKLFCKVRVVYGEPMPAAQFAMESRRDMKKLRANKQALLDAWEKL